MLFLRLTTLGHPHVLVGPQASPFESRLAENSTKAEDMLRPLAILMRRAGFEPAKGIARLIYSQVL